MRPVPNLHTCPRPSCMLRGLEEERERERERKGQGAERVRVVSGLVGLHVTGDRVCKVPRELRQPILDLLLPDRRHGVRPHQRRLLAPAVALSPVLSGAAGERVGLDVHIPVVTTLRF